MEREEVRALPALGRRSPGCTRPASTSYAIALARSRPGSRAAARPAAAAALAPRAASGWPGGPRSAARTPASRRRPRARPGAATAIRCAPCGLVRVTSLARAASPRPNSDAHCSEPACSGRLLGLQPESAASPPLTGALETSAPLAAVAIDDPDLVVAADVEHGRPPGQRRGTTLERRVVRQQPADQNRRVWGERSADSRHSLRRLRDRLRGLVLGLLRRAAPRRACACPRRRAS